MIITVREMNAALNAAKKAGGLQWLVDDLKIAIKKALDNNIQEIEMHSTVLTRNVKQLAKEYDEHIHHTQFGRR